MWRGDRLKTSGGLFKRDLVKNKRGKIVSKKKSGQASGANNLGQWLRKKGDTFEGGVRVPCIVRWPGRVPANRSVDGMMHVVDLFPTLSELCSLKPPADLQGRSLVPMLGDPASPGKNVAYTVVRRGPRLGKAIRSGRWRYALWPDGEELYDLGNDPDEYVNLDTKNVV